MLSSIIVFFCKNGVYAEKPVEPLECQRFIEEKEFSTWDSSDHNSFSTHFKREHNNRREH